VPKIITENPTALTKLTPIFKD